MDSTDSEDEFGILNIFVAVYYKSQKYLNFNRLLQISIYLFIYANIYDAKYLLYRCSFISLR